MQDKTRYRTAIFIFDVISFIGYVVVAITIMGLFIAGIMVIAGNGTLSIYGMMILSGLLVILFGLVMIGVAQIMCAIVDTADDTRRILQHLKNK